jgi:hypothetical protein
MPEGQMTSEVADVQLEPIARKSEPQRATGTSMRADRPSRVHGRFVRCQLLYQGVLIVAHQALASVRLKRSMDSSPHCPGLEVPSSSRPEGIKGAISL